MNILLVDDKKKVLDFIRPLLEQQGNTIDIASNGLDAFEKSQQQPFDLFIIDHLMPVMNGIQLSRNLLKKQKTANIPIIFMTTQNTTDVIALTRFFSFQAIIAKPIDKKILLSAVNLINKNNTSRYSL
ncbi:MAG: two-component system chemotaxis response regulator CheY [Colwellia sp.]|jgi:two-component system chemotaxis response regulator CheY